MRPSSWIRRLWLCVLAFTLLAPASALAQAPPPLPGQAPTPRGVRTLILVRHGVYDETDERDPEIGRALLAAGREQARLTGERLAAWPQPVDAVYASTMTRARETAEIVVKSLPGVPLAADRDLRECEPPGYGRMDMAGVSAGSKDSCAARIDERFARYFRPSPERDSTEVLVCHGNVIRWLVCRAMGADPKLWLSMSPANCSLTVIQVKPDGACKLYVFGDAAHLPAELQTYPGGTFAPWRPSLR